MSLQPMSGGNNPLLNAFDAFADYISIKEKEPQSRLDRFVYALPGVFSKSETIHVAKKLLEALTGGWVKPFTDEEIRVLTKDDSLKLLYLQHKSVIDVLILLSNIPEEDLEYKAEVMKAFFILLESPLSLDKDEYFFRMICDKDIARGLCVLKKAGIPYQDNSAELYEKVFCKSDGYDLLIVLFSELKFSNPEYAIELYPLFNRINKDATKKLAELFKILQSAGISCEDKGFELYKELTNRVKFIDNDNTLKLIDLFKLLKEAGILNAEKVISIFALLENDFLYLTLDCMKSLQKNNISMKGNGVDLYKVIFENPYKAKELADIFISLKKYGIPLEGNGFKLYEAIAIGKNTYVGKDLAKAFIILKEAEVPLEGNGFKLYEAIAIAEHEHVKEALVKAFIVLKEAGVPIDGNEFKLYEGIINKKFNKEELSEIFIILKKVDFPLNGNTFKLYEAIVNNAAFCLRTLEQVKALGFSAELHPSLYHAVLNEISNLNARPYPIMKMMGSLKQYVENNALLLSDSPLFSQQAKELELIVEESFSILDSFQQGPLNKNKSTAFLENSLQRIIDNYPDVSLEFNPHGYYLLKIGKYESINLSLLLENANLSQLVLEDSFINSIGEILQKIMLKNLKNIDPKFHLPEDLSATDAEQAKAILQKAAEIYSDHYYINMNKLFRSEKLDTSEGLMLSDNDSESTLACFLLGCLSSHVANSLYQEREEDIKTEQKRLIRNLDLTPTQEKALLTKRYVSFPAPSSFGFRDNKFFESEASQKIEIPNPPHYNCTTFNKGEAELLIPPGESGIITKVANRHLLWTILRSPELERPDQYWSELALAQAFENHLSKPYGYEKNSSITINRKEIERPNHNMTHTYRVMLAIELVIDYFSVYAKEDEFRLFCQNITAEEMEWLRVAAAFSITGREGECSAQAASAAARCAGYREASKEHFIQFSSVNKPFQTSETLPKLASHAVMQARMAHIIRYMGNPNYEVQKTEPQINQHPNENERKMRNFCHRILSIAHSLDLARCFHPEQYGNSLKNCRELSIESPEQQHAYDAMIRYMIDLIKAHGGGLICDIEFDGTLAYRSRCYEPQYADSSLSMKSLREMSDTVPKPEKPKAKQASPQDAQIASSLSSEDQSVSSRGIKSGR